jgi:hypothetical protein
MNIEKFVDTESIDPVYYDAAYSGLRLARLPILQHPHQIGQFP